MRPHVRLLIPLLMLLAFCVVSSSSHSASTENHTRQHSSGSLKSTASNEHVKDALCDGKVWQQQQQAAMAVSGAWGEAFDSDSYLPLLASHAEFADIFAPAFARSVRTVEAMPDPHEPFIAGLPDEEAERAAAASVPPGALAQTHDVTVGPNGELMFDPIDLTINVGDTVRWTWASPNHTVTSGAGCTSDSQYCSPANSNCSVGSASNTGFVYTHTFNTPGSYPYFCKVHCSTFNMKGSVVVQGAASTFSISGKVTTGGNAVSGVQMSLSGAQSASTTTDTNGNYSFSSLAAGNYTVTPTDIRYTFTPGSRSYTSLSANQANQDFTATPEPLTISGQVRLGTSGLSSVTMTLTSPTPAGFTPRSVMTDGTGNYSLTNVPAGRNYTLTPSKSGFTFKNTSNTAQSTRSYTNLSENQLNQDFTATATTGGLSISGQVKVGTSALASVTMTLTSPTPTGFTPRTLMTNSTGNYSFADVPAGRNYTLTPSKSGFTFSPVNRTYTSLSASQTAQNFAATATTSSFSISGFVKVGTTALAGVTMTLSSPTPAGFAPRTLMTTSTGGFSFTNVPGGRNYTLTPSKTGYTFKNTSNTAQSTRTYTNLSANQTNQNFAATVNGFTISGFVKVGTTALAGVTMKLVSTTAGFTPRTVLTTSTGGYTFTGVPGGRSYTLTPSKTNYTFKNTSDPTKAFRSYTNLSANQTNQNFAATLKTYTISGRVTQTNTTTGIASVTMTLTSPTPAGFTPRTIQTNSTGAFSLTGVPAARNYTLTPSKSGFTFSPANRSYTNLSANQTGAAASFTGTPSAPSPSTVEFTDSSYRVGEGDGRVEIKVTRSGDASAPATIDYEVNDITASDRSDYSTSLGTLRFDAGETGKSFTIFITDDAYVEGDETMTLTLGNGTNGVEAGSQSVATLTVEDNDTDPSAANPIDDTAFFVRQQHVDLLNRDIDPEVLSSYIDNLNRCSAQHLCYLGLSAGLHLKFKSWGDLIYRLYKLSFGRPPLYREFIRDTNLIRSLVEDRQVSNGYETFFNEWVERPAFKERYGALSDRDFLDRLWQTDVKVRADSEARVSALESGSQTRAEVLSDLLKYAELSQQANDAAFVTMLYFGYLRRDPDEAGFKTLLEIRSQHPKDYHPLIQTLTDSADYRSRFGRP